MKASECWTEHGCARGERRAGRPRAQEASAAERAPAERAEPGSTRRKGWRRSIGIKVAEAALQAALDARDLVARPGGEIAQWARHAEAA